jgi:hypothetical protein
MSGPQTELDETSTPVAKVKLELPDDNQKKKGLRRIFQEYPRGGRAAALVATRRRDHRRRPLREE